MSEEMIRLRGVHGQDEVNCRGVSYKVRWGVVTVPAEDVGPLIQVGGFHIARPDDPSAQHSTIDDVREAAWHLPLGPTRDAIINFLNQQ